MVSIDGGWDARTHEQEGLLARAAEASRGIPHRDKGASRGRRSPFLLLGVDRLVPLGSPHEACPERRGVPQGDTRSEKARWMWCPYLRE